MSRAKRSRRPQLPKLPKLHLQLVRTLPAFAPRPAFERTDSRIDPILSLAFVPGTTDIITIGRFGLQRFALDRDEPVWSVAADGHLGSAIALSPDGERLFTIGDDDRLVERDAYTGVLRWSWAERLHHTTSIAFSRDGNDLLWSGSSVPGNPSGFSVPAVDLYDTTTMARRWRWEGRDWRSSHGAVFVPLGVAAAQSNGQIVILDRASGLIAGGLVHGGRALRASRDGRTMIFSDEFLVVLRNNLVVGQAPMSSELAAIDPEGRHAVIAPYFQTDLYIVWFDPVGVCAQVELADKDLDSISNVACSDRGLVAAGTNGGHTYVYELTSLQ